MAETTENTPKPKAKPIEFTQEIVLATDSFDVTQEHLVTEAQAQFFQVVAEAHPGKTLTNVRLIKTNHHIGSFGYYTFVGDVS